MNARSAQIKKFFLKSWIPISGIAILVAAELILRLGFGLGNPVLSQADTYTGYRFQPNQKLLRFGKRIEYNQYSQRSESISLQKPQGTFRILMVGDSVLNGGNPTDQTQIVTELLEAKIEALGRSAEVLNASAGSWGIGNQLGYLQEFGTFESDAVILQIGTHDLTQPTSTSDRVGHDPSYPDRLPLLAIQESVTRYVLPIFLARFNSQPIATEIPQVSSAELTQQFQKNMALFKAIVTLVRTQQTPIYVLFTPERENLIPKAKIPLYKSEFTDLLNSLQISQIDTYEAWSKLPTTVVKNFFRDFVHLSEAGNEAAASLIFQDLCIQQKIKGCSETAPDSSPSPN